VYVTPGPSVAAVVPSASPSTPTQDDIRTTAAAAYRQAVLPGNKARKSLWKTYKDKTSLKAWLTYCSKLAVVTHTELVALKAITYPEDTAADAKILIRADAAGEADLRSCAVASNWAAWNKAFKLALKANDRAHEAANLVRLDLGLKSVGA
jgi:hypothetical protein